MQVRYCILDYRIRRQTDVAISALSPALLYGDSLFETLPVVETVPVFLKAHLARLNYSAECFNYVSRLRQERIRVAVDNLLTGNLLENGRLRITLFRGSPGLSNAASLRGDSELAPVSLDEPHREHVLIQVDTLVDKAPCACGLIRVNNRHLDPLARHKTGNRLFYRQFRTWEHGGPARKQMFNWLHPSRMDEQEIVVVDELDRLLEATVSNLFLVIDGRIHTPPRELGLLPGIVRGRLLSDERLQCVSREIGLKDLELADEAFLTNSVVGVRPLTRLGNREFEQAPGPVTRRALASMETQMLEDIAPHM